MFDVFEVGIQIGATVHATDGMCGHAVYLIVDPILEKITHLVVQEDDPPATSRLLPIGLVQSVRHNEIQIKCGTEQFKKLDTFREAEFLPSSESAPDSRFWPHVGPERPLGVADHEKISAGEVEIISKTAAEQDDHAAE